MNKKQISINIISNAIAFLIGLTITFILTPYLIKSLGKAAYGFFPMANNLISYTSIITIAINSMANRFIAVSFHEGDTKKAQKFFNTTLIINIVMAIILFILGSIVILFLDNLINIPSYLIKDVKLLFVIILFASMFLLTLSVYKTSTFVKNRIDINAYVNIFKSVIRAVILIILFSLFNPSIVFVGIASGIIFIIEGLSYIQIKKRIMPELRFSIKDFSWKYSSNLLKSGIWVSLEKINVILFLGLDLLIANLFLGASDMGVLAITKTIPTYAYTIINIIAISFIPSLTSAFAINSKKLFYDLIKTFIPLTLFGSIIIGGIIGLGDLFYGLWLPNEDKIELYILTVLALLPTVVSFGVHTVGSILVVINKIRINSIVNLITAFISVLFTIILLAVTNFGLYVVAGVSSIFTLILYFSFSYPHVAKNIGLPRIIFFPYILKSWICMGVVIFISYTIRNIIIIETWLSFCFAVIIVVLVSFILNFFIVTNKYNRKYLILKAKELLLKQIK